MSPRSHLAQFIAHTSRKFLTTFTNGGSSLPGKLALTIDPNILEPLAADYDVIVVTGTNGKTLTTSLIVRALREKYDHVITNESGSNMKQGIVGTFLAAKKKANTRGIAVLEVDEGSLKRIIPELNPQTFVHTNIFADQLDRYGSTQNVYQLLADASISMPEATVISNGDIPVIRSIELPNRRIFFGFDAIEPYIHQTIPQTSEDIHCPNCQNLLEYEFITYANQGNYHCTHCGYHRPSLDAKVTQIHELKPDGTRFDIDGITFELPVAGHYNIYNALAAYTTAREYDVASEQIQAAFRQTERVFGRQELMTLEDKEIVFNLVKNTVGLNQVIKIVQLEDEPMSLAFILHNNDADGTEIDWIDDGDFEALKEQDIQQIYASGMEAEAIAKRLEEAKLIDTPVRRHPDIDALIEQLKQAPTQRIHVVANYTAMMEFRKAMQENGYL
ncbi:DUF1727 domain-containing protein [Aerococcaceae bacterium DSM 111020]|nr:DUF1727 domain-containing protein [Aerococcaceae bacterium DSM 111020]